MYGGRVMFYILHLWNNDETINENAKRVNVNQSNVATISKGNIWETLQRPGKAHAGFSERIDESDLD